MNCLGTKAALTSSEPAFGLQLSNTNAPEEAPVQGRNTLCKLILKILMPWWAYLQKKFL
jgi:hypothetical protein